MPRLHNVVIHGVTPAERFARAVVPLSRAANSLAILPCEVVSGESLCCSDPIREAECQLFVLAGRAIGLAFSCRRNRSVCNALLALHSPGARILGQKNGCCTDVFSGGTYFTDLSGLPPVPIICETTFLVRLV